MLVPVSAGVYPIKSIGANDQTWRYIERAIAAFLAQSECIAALPVNRYPFTAGMVEFLRNFTFRRRKYTLVFEWNFS